jgi:hypothetical protein
LALLGIGVGSWYQLHLREQRDQLQAALEVAEEARTAEAAARQRVEEERLQKEAALERAESSDYLHRIALAHRHFLDNTVSRAEQLLDGCPAALRRWEWHYLQRLCRSGRVPLQGVAQPCSAAVFSPDASRVAAIEGGTIHLWDASNGHKLRSLRPPAGGASSLAFRPDGTQLAAGFGEGGVALWDLGTGRELRSWQAHPVPVIGAAFSPDGARLATCAGRLNTFSGGAGLREVKVWDSATGKEVLTLPGHVEWSFCVAFSHDGKQLASTGWDRGLKRGEIKLWDAATGKLLRTLHGHTAGITTIAFSPDDARLASASWDRTALAGKDATLKIWDLARTAPDSSRAPAGPTLNRCVPAKRQNRPLPS